MIFLLWYNLISQIAFKGHNTKALAATRVHVFRNNLGQQYPKVFSAAALLSFSSDCPFCLSLLVPPSRRTPLHLSVHLRVCKAVYTPLPKRHWQSQIKMGGECASRSPRNAKEVECHKSLFDLSNQVGSCCMQTFVIGGRGVRCQVYSGPSLHWAAAAGAYMRMEGWKKGWRDGEKVVGKRRKGHDH